VPTPAKVHRSPRRSENGSRMPEAAVDVKRRAN
jgi:hypothetical protein